jgi:antitoxin HigA-1
MIQTKRKPVGVGEMLTDEFLEPEGLTQNQLASLMGVSRKLVNELCTNKGSITVDTALMLAKVFGNSADFWLNLQRRNDIWKALHTPKRKDRISKARPLHAEASL